MNTITIEREIIINFPEDAPPCCCGEDEDDCAGGWCVWNMGYIPGTQIYEWVPTSWSRLPCVWGSGPCSCAEPPLKDAHEFYLEQGEPKTVYMECGTRQIIGWFPGNLPQ